ncbi:hypothetical protein ACIA8R_30930 [Nonomuraea sp. NPDC051191]|uniref:hypothetical protein n=1 Tax=Nonomuraea sp. NPDC051191 TaxID=3364372 RepID=UPI00379E6BB2
MRWPFMLERAGRSGFAWNIPEWFGMGGAPHVLRRGDTIAAEIFAFYGGMESQQQIDVCVGEPDALRDGKRVCIGGTVLLTASGPEELNTIPNRLNVVD